MNGFEYPEDDELFLEEEEDVDESFGVGDGFADQRRRFGRGPRHIRAGNLPRGGGLVRPQTGGGHATRTYVDAGFSRIGKQIRDVSDGVKKVAAQASKITTDLAAANAAQDKRLRGLEKRVADQSTASILPLLLSKPQLEVKAGAGGNATATADAVVQNVQFKKADILLPLLLTGGLGGGSGATGGDLFSNPIVLLAIMDKL